MSANRTIADKYKSIELSLFELVDGSIDSNAIAKLCHILRFSYISLCYTAGHINLACLPAS